MTNWTNLLKDLFNQNFYGFCLLIVAAFFFYLGKNEAAQAFSYIGSALMGVRQYSSAPTLNTAEVTIIPKTGN